MSADAFGNSPAMSHDEMVEAGLIEDNEEQTLTRLGAAHLADQLMDVMPVRDALRIVSEDETNGRITPDEIWTEWIAWKDIT